MGTKFEGLGRIIASRASIYRIDPLNLGIFRAVLGSAFLFQIIVYFLPVRHISFYPDAAIDPQSLKLLAGPISYSVMDLFQSRLLVDGFFGLTILLCILFIIGYRSRLVSFLFLFAMWNIYQRGVFASGSESNYAMVLLTVACFLPLNSAFVPKRFRQAYTYPTLLYDLLCAALIIQVGWIYFSTGLFKIDPAWSDGTALQHIFGLDPLNAYAFWHNRPFLWTKPLAYIIPFGEIALGFFIMVYPADRGAIRWLLGLGVASLHLGIIVFLNLWQFTFFALAASCVLIPFSRLFSGRRTPDAAPRTDLEESARYGWKEGLAVFYIVLIALINVGMLSNRSMVAPALHKLKVKQVVKVLKPPKVDYASSLNQHWSLYGYIPRPFSCVSLTGIGEDGTLYDLVIGGARGDMCCYRTSLAEKEHLELIRIIYYHAAYELIYPELIRCYYRHWLREHPEIPLTGLEARRYYYENGQTAYDVLVSVGE